MIRLDYLTGALCELQTSPRGYYELKGVEQYYNAVCRNKVILRADLLFNINTIFSREALQVYRTAIYNLIAGYIVDKNKIQILFEWLYCNDSVFKQWLARLLYFSGDTVDLSVYDYLMREVRQKYESWLCRFQYDMKLAGARFMFDSNCYGYFAINDACRELIIPGGYEVEVYSCAKVWNGNIQVA